MNIKYINNWIEGAEYISPTQDWVEKVNPHNGELLSLFHDSTKHDVTVAVESALNAFDSWASLSPIKRGQHLSDFVNQMQKASIELIACVSKETGKSKRDALGEVNASILQGQYWASEGMRLHGKSLTSSISGKSSHTIRQPRGVAGLIVPANTPLANLAWKVFPALLCGNTVVIKASEDAPELAYLFASLSKEAGIPDGVLNVIQGKGSISGAALVDDENVSIISFTGSTAVGKLIAEKCSKRLARVSLELGGKNPFIVCDDADIDQAVYWALQSAYSNAGQRCAAGSRIIVFKSIYDQFIDKFIEGANLMKLGIDDDCAYGPVINKKQHDLILTAIRTAIQDGGNILCGGDTPNEECLAKGYYIKPTLIEGLHMQSSVSRNEIFGPLATLYTVNDLEEALNLANDSEFGLTSAIHTRNIDRALWFAHRIRAGVANINLGTYGSEPHMPFGGFGLSGNGTREPGAEALDVYSELKNISILTRNFLL